MFKLETKRDLTSHFNSICSFVAFLFIFCSNSLPRHSGMDTIHSWIGIIWMAVFCYLTGFAITPHISSFNLILLSNLWMVNDLYEQKFKSHACKNVNVNGQMALITQDFPKKSIHKHCPLNWNNSQNFTEIICSFALPVSSRRILLVWP